MTSSDHFPIIIQYISRSNDSLMDERWNFKNPDWPLYSELLDEEIRSIKYEEILYINTLVNNFTNSIIQVASLTICKSTVKNRKP